MGFMSGSDIREMVLAGWRADIDGPFTTIVCFRLVVPVKKPQGK